jgi:uncharacterized repeat protein (TIGR03803 family)
MPLRREHSLLRRQILLCLAFLLYTISALHAQTPTTLYTFTGGPDGGFSESTLVIDAAGNLYGTTTAGGPSGNGTVFKIDSSNNFTVLYSFAPGDGHPLYGLVMDSAGNLYGTTLNGGVLGLGTVYKIDTSNNFTVLYTFDRTGGSNPFGPLIIDPAGNLYGTASTGGSSGLGTVFKIDASNHFSVLHSFAGGDNDGSIPYGALVMDSSGNLFGTTDVGGGENAGTVFEITSSNTYSVLYTFLAVNDGGNPLSGLMIDSAGNMYGTASTAGAGFGTLFNFTSSGGVNVLHAFAGGADGATPYAAPVKDAYGSLYGTTYYGGSGAAGTVYRYDSQRYFTVVHNFSNGTGGTPGGLVMDAAGYLYGVTMTGGASQFGAVYKLPSSGVITQPPKHSVLSGSTANFTWTPEAGATSYQMWVGSAAGAHDLGTIGTSGLQVSITNLPTDGRLIYATLWGYDSNGSWAVQDSAGYQAASSTKAQITSPPKGSTLPGNVATFAWSAETGATSYQLWLGSTAGAFDLGTIGTSGLAGSTSSLPTDGRTIYATLWGYDSGGNWAVQDTATYTAALFTNAQITSPAKGSTLVGSAVFTWTAETGATSYQVWVGSTPGTDDITYAGSNGLSGTVSGLPSDGRVLYVTLWGYSGGVWTVQDTGSYAAGYSKVIMSLVLDRSGSMTSDGGATALQAAVPQFVNQFNNSWDEVGLISFGDNAEVDVPIGYNFTSPIVNAVAAMPFGGGTFGTGAGSQPVLSSTEGPPMSLADLQNNSVLVYPGQNVVKVMVYFTDGLMNTIQDNFSCPTQVLLNYGGFDAQGSQYGDIFDPSSKTTIFGTASSTGFPYNAQGTRCKNSDGTYVTTFPSQLSGGQKSFLQFNISAEAEYRAIYTANAMRSETPIPTYIYTIGLGTGITAGTQNLLAQLANDPSYPTYISSQPAGEFFYIQDCPSSNCTAELQAAFLLIASRLR